MGLKRLIQRFFRHYVARDEADKVSKLAREAEESLKEATQATDETIRDFRAAMNGEDGWMRIKLESESGQERQFDCVARDLLSDSNNG